MTYDEADAFCTGLHGNLISISSISDFVYFSKMVAACDRKYNYFFIKEIIFYVLVYAFKKIKNSLFT
jgi:hypothetical protein